MRAGNCGAHGTAFHPSHHQWTDEEFRTSNLREFVLNYRSPGPRRGGPRVGSAPNVAETLETVETVQSSVKL